MSSTIIEFEQVSYTYPGARQAALENITLAIKPGQLVFISGESGSGKSTLLNIINGVIPEVLEGDLIGKILINAQENLSIYQRNLAIANVFQNPRSQFFTTDSTSELVFEMENYGHAPAEIQQRVNEILQHYQVAHLIDRHIFELSSGERQLLALLTALMMQPDAILFDEPSANLDYGNAMRLRRQFQALLAEGKTVIVADHRCFYLDGMIDQVLLLEDKQVHLFDSETAFRSSPYHHRVFDLFAHEFPTNVICHSDYPEVELKNVTYRSVLSEIDVTFNRQEVAVIVGNNGAGKTTLAKLIAQILKPSKGQVVIEQQALYLMQDADFQLFGATCLKELEISSKDQAKNLEALAQMNLLHLKDAHPQLLSGGEKQRLQMAICLVSEHPVIVMDEPTSGLDRTSMACVVAAINCLKQERAIIIISHDYEFIRQTADRVLYLKDHRVAADFYLEQANIAQLNEIYKQMEDFYVRKDEA